MRVQTLVTNDPSSNSSNKPNTEMNEKQSSGSTKRKLTTILALCVAGLLSTSAATPPKQGETAPNFTLRTLDDRTVELRELTAKRRLVLVVLRGWPGYQCPICERQVRDLIGGTAKLKRHDVQMLFVYPGPADQLKARAQDFLQSKDWPPDFLFVTDPDYAFTNAYGLRWDAPNETAYPSTFIIDRKGTVQFAHVSREHADRIGLEQLLKQL